MPADTSATRAMIEAKAYAIVNSDQDIVRICFCSLPYIPDADAGMGYRVIRVRISETTQEGSDAG